MTRRRLGLIVATAGAAAVVAVFLPWWRLPGEQVFGLGIPGYEVAGIERWHGWAAGAAGIAMLILGGALAAKPDETRAVAIPAAVCGVALLAIAAVAVLTAGSANRPGPGVLLAGSASLAGLIAALAAAARKRDRPEAWSTGRPG